jgi:hypothetical protein
VLAWFELLAPNAEKHCQNELNHQQNEHPVLLNLKVIDTLEAVGALLE